MENSKFKIGIDEKDKFIKAFRKSKNKKYISLIKIILIYFFINKKIFIKQ